MGSVCRRIAPDTYIFGGVIGNGEGSGEVGKVKDWFREK